MKEKKEKAMCSEAGGVRVGKGWWRVGKAAASKKRSNDGYCDERL